MVKRQAKKIPGRVYAIPLKDGSYAFAQICEGKDFAFFDFKTFEIPSLDRIVQSKIAFRIPIGDSVPSDGHWQSLGVAPLDVKLALPERYLHRPVGSEQVYIHVAGLSTLASLEQVKDLEVLAVWFLPHVEERLEDFFAGRPNQIALNLRKKR